MTEFQQRIRLNGPVDNNISEWRWQSNKIFKFIKTKIKIVDERGSNKTN